MAGLVSWLAALPSEDEEEDQVQQGRNLLPAAAVADAEFHIVEDDDVQVLNVVKYQEERGQPGALAAGQFFHPWQTFSGRDKMPGAPQHGMDVIEDALYHFQDTPIPPRCHQHVEPIQRSQRRNDARNQLSRATASFDKESGRDVYGDFRYGGVADQWRKDVISRELPSHSNRQEVLGTGRTSANVDQTHLNGRRVFQEHYYNVTGGQRPREFGILGGGPASQVREQGTIALDNFPQLRGPGFIVMEREPGLASTGCERLLFAPGRSTGRYVEQESFYIPGSPQPTVQGGHQGKGPVATRYSLEGMVVGKTMDDWWSSLLEVVGTNLSGLHWDIVNFCKTLELTQEQKQIRRDALEYVEKTVHELWPSAQVHLFGSTATGLALPWSDIDVAVISHQDSSGQKSATVSWLSELGRYLKRHGQCKSLKQIPHAKVPLLKVVFRSGLACDISFDSHNGPRGVPVIRHFMQQYEALHPLCLVLKFFLGQQNLNELWTGGLGSFCLITMVVSHLQKLGTTGTGHDLGVLLLSFFTRYCTMHNYRTDVVSTRADICASKQAKGWVNLTDPELLSVEDPLDPTSDIAKGSYKIKDVRTIFLKAKTLLLTHWHHDNVLAKLVDAKEDQNQRPNVQDEKYQGNKQRKQKKKKRKKCDTAGSEMEDGQPVQLKRKQKAHCHKGGKAHCHKGGEAHCHKGGGLAARSMKQKKKLKKKNERADPKEGRRAVKLSDFLDSHSTGFESRLKRQRG